VTVTAIEDSAERSRICREILAELPGWFGLPESNARYEREVADYLQVKTLGPSRPCERYKRTRRFYEARGFVPLEELHAVWDENNPCLILVKHVACR
jgi:hypothetical protein